MRIRTVNLTPGERPLPRSLAILTGVAATGRVVAFDFSNPVNRDAKFTRLSER